MLNNHLLSDVKFVVRQSDGESESKRVIPAHKFVLSIGSPVFEVMFYGELAETRDSIELPDCEYESLLELFRYMYSDEVNLSGSNVIGVLYLAKKYMVPSLTEKCTDYLQNNLDPSNVFVVMQFALVYEEKDLIDRCWKVIDEHADAAVKSDGFATLERSLLEEVIERDTLNIREVELFKGVVEWASKKSEKRGIVVDGHGRRGIIGEQIVKAIRFSEMKEDEFNSVVVKSKLLTFDEVKNISNRFNSMSSFCEEFSVITRCGPSLRADRLCRFPSAKYGWIGFERVHFSVDSDIRFHGVYLFGKEDSSHSVGLTLEKTEEKNILSSTEGKFLSLRHESGDYFGFDVLFQESAFLRKDIVYCIQAVINGPKTWYGINGNREVQRSGVTFTFYATEGQFSEFIFSL